MRCGSVPAGLDSAAAGKLAREAVPEFELKISPSVASSLTVAEGH
jgi:hypothetical protein